ncbi:hypothetical protein ACWGS9_15680 [Bradyrhizobium sp. Arg314]
MITQRGNDAVSQLRVGDRLYGFALEGALDEISAAGDLVRILDPCVVLTGRQLSELAGFELGESY